MYSVYHCIQKPTSPLILISSKSSAAKQGQYFQYFDYNIKYDFVQYNLRIPESDKTGILSPPDATPGPEFFLLISIEKIYSENRNLRILNSGQNCQSLYI